MVGPGGRNRMENIRKRPLMFLPHSALWENPKWVMGRSGHDFSSIPPDRLDIFGTQIFFRTQILTPTQSHPQLQPNPNPSPTQPNQTRPNSNPTQPNPDPTYSQTRVWLCKPSLSLLVLTFLWAATKLYSLSSRNATIICLCFSFCRKWHVSFLNMDNVCLYKKVVSCKWTQWPSVWATEKRNFQ